MRILSIETSCDETAISILESKGAFPRATVRILGNALYSQVALHAKMGGVVPMLAKREHGINLIPLFKDALLQAGLLKELKRPDPKFPVLKIKKLLEREPELAEQFVALLPTLSIPKIDAIAVTSGPGLEPALWVGINFARALGAVWQKPVIPINHMEGHILAALLEKPSENQFSLAPVQFPAISLLISGGHTELVHMRDWLKYEIIGETRDDAAGEAFDKVARMLELPYPGGPEISKMALLGHAGVYPLPRPMLSSDNLDFSFSGLKTAVLYTLKKIPNPSAQDKADLAREFEESVIEVLTKKTLAAARKHKAQTIILGGGVTANSELRRVFNELQAQNLPGVALHIPDQKFSTDNAIMIGLAAIARITLIPKYKTLLKKKVHPLANIKAAGSMRLGKVVRT